VLSFEMFGVDTVVPTFDIEASSGYDWQTRATIAGSPWSGNLSCQKRTRAGELPETVAFARATLQTAGGLLAHR
jgi:hypothetical protein